MKLNISKRAEGGSGSKASASSSACSKAIQAMTLVEMMVAMGVGSIVLAVVATVFTTGTCSFAAMGGYVNMDGHSRNALDHLTQEIRSAGNLVEFSPTHLKFGYQGQTNSFLVFDWNATSGQLTEWNTATTTTNVLLTGGSQLAFSLYTAGFAPTTIPSQGKGISVSWTCSQTILGRKASEDMQQALIIIRNQPL